MKKLFLLFASAVLLGSANAQTIANQSSNKIQIAILFDTSGSMDGLIDQAKNTIWQIVNAATKLKQDGKTPKLEIALYDYGNTDIQNPTFVRLQAGLISDLDSISSILFGLYTNGGDEYCASVIHNSLDDLKWSSDPNDVRLIYIAGNEPFNQGPENYVDILKKAAERNIVVNTIYCGPYEQGVQEFWYDASLITQGNYFHINSNDAIQYITTPYDSLINQRNTSLNSTYMYYGNNSAKLANVVAQDKNAEQLNNVTLTERAISKSNSNYENSSWDLVDAYKRDTLVLQKMKEEQLPKELQQKTMEEKEAILKKQLDERNAQQQEINELAKKREQFITEERTRLAAETGNKDLGTSIIESMNTIAGKKGYKVE